MHLTAKLIAMAEMADLATASDKLEVTKKAGESPPDSSSQPTKEASLQASSASPPASAEKQAEKKSEKSPPASDQPEEKKPEDSPQPHKEEVTLKVGSSAAAEDPSPPESKKPEVSKDPSLPEPKSQDSVEDDLLEFTSATEGEASSSAWELVPERKIARKKGVKSDSEIDSLVKKVIKEAEEPTQAQVTSKDVTSSAGASSTSAKDAVASIPEDPAAETAEEEGSKAEALAAEKSSWEADFSLEDAPTPPSKDVLSTGMGRENLMVPGVTAEDEDSEMAEADPAAVGHLGSSAKRKGRSTSQGAATKRALPPKPPRASSVGPKAKSPPADKPASANKMPRAASPPGKAESKAAGKPAVKPPPKSITPLSAHAAAKPPPKPVTSKAASSKEDKAWDDWEKAPKQKWQKGSIRRAWLPRSHRRCSRSTGAASPPVRTSSTRLPKSTAWIPTRRMGYNHHVASFYYVSTDWGVSSPPVLQLNHAQKRQQAISQLDMRPLSSFSHRDC